MFERAPNGFFVRDLIVFNHLRRGGYVSKGFVFEAPDLTNSPVADLNDFQDQLCLLLASLHENQRLQVQYFCDSDYKGELLRYQQETETFSNVWTKRARNERFTRYWQAMSERKLRRQRVIFYISRALENVPEVVPVRRRPPRLLQHAARPASKPSSSTFTGCCWKSSVQAARACCR